MIDKIIILIVFVYVLFRYFIISEDYTSSLLIENASGSVSLGNITGPMITNGSIPVINMVSVCSDSIYYGLDNNNVIMVSSNSSRYYQIPGASPAISSITDALVTSTYWPSSLAAPGSSKYKYISLTTSVPPNNLGSLYGRLIYGNIPVAGSVTVGSDTVYYTRNGTIIQMVGMPSAIAKYYVLTPADPAIPTDAFVAGIFATAPAPIIAYQYTPLAPTTLVPGNQSPTPLGTMSDYGTVFPVINSVLINNNPIYYSLNGPMLRMIDPKANISKLYVYTGTNQTITVNDSDVVTNWGTSGIRALPDAYIFTPTPLTIVPGSTPAVNLGTFSGSSISGNGTIPVINSVSSGSDTVYYAFNNNTVVMVSTTGTIKCNSTVTGIGIKPISNSDVIGFWSSAPSGTGYTYNNPPSILTATNVSTTDLGTMTGSLILCTKPIVNKVTVGSDTVFYTLSDNYVIMINQSGTVSKYYTSTASGSVSVSNTDVISYWPNAKALPNVKSTLIAALPPPPPGGSTGGSAGSAGGTSTPVPIPTVGPTTIKPAESDNTVTYIVVGVVVLALLGGGAYFAMGSKAVPAPKKSRGGSEYYFYDIGK